MKFEIEAPPFVKMVQLLGENRPARELKLCIVACGDHVRVQTSALAAEMEARITEEGQCTLSCSRFLRALKTVNVGANLTVEADPHRLRLGRHTLSVQEYKHDTRTSDHPQVAFASSWGCVHPSAGCVD